MSPTSAFAAPTSLATRPSLAGGAVCAPPAHTGAVAAPRRGAVSMAFSSIEGVLTDSRVALPQAVDSVVAAVYHQVFGNAHVMESERAEVSNAESEFRISRNVREFVRGIALSDTYKARFFESVSQYRFIELAFKHFLGRAPSSAAEYATVMNVYHTQGYEACVSWFIDSVEYDESFGNFIVPYGKYKGMYPTNEVFNRSVAMRLTPSQSDKGRPTMLQYCVLSGDSPSWLSIAKGLPAGTERGTGMDIRSPWKRNDNAPVRQGTKIPGGVVFYN